MKYEDLKQYVISKYSDVSEKEIEFLFDTIESLYLSKTSPFDLSVEFDENNKRATNWVTRAVCKIIENGEIDITSYSENGLSIALGESMMSELIPYAGVGKNVLE